MGLPWTDSAGKRSLSLIAKQADAIAITEQYCWRDGGQIFDVTSKRLRLLLNQGNSLANKNILRWNHHLDWTPDQNSLWQRIWISFLPEKNSYFAWQVLFHAPATNKWRFQKIRGPHPSKRCERCLTGATEDVADCMWECSKAQVIWHWIASLAPLTSPDPSQVCNFGMG